MNISLLSLKAKIKKERITNKSSLIVEVQALCSGQAKVIRGPHTPQFSHPATDVTKHPNSWNIQRKKNTLLSNQKPLTANVRHVSNQVRLMTINALNFLPFLNCFATSVSQLKITIQQWEPIKPLVFQPRCLKIVCSTVFWLTILWSWFQSTGTDNYRIKYGESCLRRHEQHAALATLAGEIQAGYSYSDRTGDGEYPKSILADRASHIIPPTHHIASRHQIHQDAKPNWQWQQHTPSPIQNTGLWLHLEKRQSKPELGNGQI